MTMNKHAALAALGATLVVALSPAGAASAPAGAKAADKELTCADITAERTAIADAVTSNAAKRQSAAKVKKGLFGFAKTFAGMAIPGAAASLGGASMIGSLAAQSVGQSAAQAVGSMSNGDAATPAAAAPSKDQQARLDRLASIAAYRQCTA